MLTAITMSTSNDGYNLITHWVKKVLYFLWSVLYLLPINFSGKHLSSSIVGEKGKDTNSTEVDGFMVWLSIRQLHLIKQDQSPVQEPGQINKSTCVCVCVIISCCNSFMCSIMSLFSVSWNLSSWVPISAGSQDVPFMWTAWRRPPSPFW